MSMFTLLSTAVAVPLATVVLVFFWFLIRAQAAALKKRWNRRNRPSFQTQTATIPLNNFKTPLVASVSLPVMTPNLVGSDAGSTPPEYQPLSYFLGENITSTAVDTSPIEFDLKDIPGINTTIQNELYALGYTSVEQIARWGRADVRAVSALLGVEQYKIEEEWIEGARLILSIR